MYQIPYFKLGIGAGASSVAAPAGTTEPRSISRACAREQALH